MTNTTPTTTSSAPEGAIAFTFGEPESVLDKSALLDLLFYCEHNDRWYAPPVSFDELAKTFRAAVHHSSPLYVKRNILVRAYRGHKLLSKADFARWALDYLVFGNAYMERVPARNGRTFALRPVPARYVRRGVDMQSYYWLPQGGMVQGKQEEELLPAGQIHHLQEPDINQEVYGLPEYISALNSTLLNEAATIFRRRYYKNGSHAGYILYLTDPQPNHADVDALREALRQSKGPGNFRNLFFHSPNGKPDGMKLIPVAEVAAKDGFGDIKNTTRDDQLSAHRVPPQLLGILPNNTSGFGDVEKAALVFARNEVEPLQERMRELNDWAGEEVLTFDPYSLAPDAPDAAPVARSVR